MIAAAAGLALRALRAFETRTFDWLGLVWFYFIEIEIDNAEQGGPTSLIRRDGSVEGIVGELRDQQQRVLALQRFEGMYREAAMRYSSLLGEAKQMQVYSVFLCGRICTKVGACSYYENFEKEWSSYFLRRFEGMYRVAVIRYSALLGEAKQIQVGALCSADSAEDHHLHFV
jgi:hypothetical protein